VHTPCAQYSLCAQAWGQDPQWEGSFSTSTQVPLHETSPQPQVGSQASAPPEDDEEADDEDEDETDEDEDEDEEDDEEADEDDDGVEEAALDDDGPAVDALEETRPPLAGLLEAPPDPRFRSNTPSPQLVQKTASSAENAIEASALLIASPAPKPTRRAAPEVLSGSPAS
jgi:hypothetical protein